MMNRCEWCGDDPLYRDYHDHEWGVPVHDDQLLCEFLVLEGAQARLSWLTILKKRENYRKAFDGFACRAVAGYPSTKVERLPSDSGIVSHRRKIESAIKNARGLLKVQDEFSWLDTYLWRYVQGEPKQNEWKSLAELPTRTAVSAMMSKDLKKRGFNFVGPTICYASMQAVGMGNDRTTDCDRHDQVKVLSDA